MASISDPSWGFDHHELLELKDDDIRVCLVTVTDLTHLAEALTNSVSDTSWMTDLDEGSRRSYEPAVAATAKVLKEIFAAVNNNVSAEFGEIMVSRGSARALEILFGHKAIPLSELWKPKIKQNEGFDFHTICLNPLINFGEAKYAANRNPHGNAINQIDEFLDAKKHLLDRVYLRDLCPPESIASLDVDHFGVVAAFSVNAIDPKTILANARTAARVVAKKHSLKQVFVVGVVRETR